MSELLLIVEDDPSLREVIRLGLEGEGYRVVVAEEGPAALAAYAAHRPDLVLLDIMLPGLDGFAVCREIRKTSLVPIVMLTARASTVDVLVGLESGADDYVTKPFEFPELIARVRSVLRRASVKASAEGTPEAGAAISTGGVAYPAEPPPTASRPGLTRERTSSSASSITPITTAARRVARPRMSLASRPTCRSMITNRKSTMTAPA